MAEDVKNQVEETAEESKDTKQEKQEAWEKVFWWWSG